MASNAFTRLEREKLGQIKAVLSLVLTAAVAVFVLGLAVRMGQALINSLAPAQAEAAAEVPPPPEVPATSPQVELVPPTETAVPPTATLVPTPTPQTLGLVKTAPPELTPIPPTPRLVVDVDMMNVRRGPGTGYEAIGQLAAGAEAVITGRYGGWWRIDYEGQDAYLFGELVTAYDTETADGSAVADLSVVDLPGPSIGNPLFEPAPTWAIDAERWIDVDLSEQRVTAYEGKTPVRRYLVSTGLPATPTPVGQFRIWVKFRYDDMEGDDYYLEDVPWVMYFHQGYGFHGVWWHANWGHPMSHGCINQPNEMAEWLFSFADVGTLVNIHE